MVDEYYKQTEFSGSAMAYFPSRVVNEICKKSARLFAHTLVFGLAAMQFGCASLHSKADYQTIPTQTLLEGMKAETQGRTVGFISAQDYHDIFLRLIEGTKELRDNLSNPKEDQRAIYDRRSATFKKGLIEKTKDIFHDDEMRKRFETTLDTMSINDADRMFDKYDANGQPNVVFLKSGDNVAALVVMPSVDDIFKPGKLGELTIDSMTGMQGFDAALGPEFAKKMRFFTLCHELVHTGQDLAMQMFLGGQNLDVPKDYKTRTECEADVRALNLYYHLTGDMDFLKTIMYARAVDAVSSIEEGHASASDIADLIRQLNPSESVPDSMAPERVVAAIEGLAKAGGKVCGYLGIDGIEGIKQGPYPDLPNLPPSPVYEEQSVVDCVRDNTKKLQDLYAIATTPDQKKLIDFAIEGLAYLSRSLDQSRTDSVSKADPVTRHDVKGTSSSPASRVAAGPT